MARPSRAVNFFNPIEQRLLRALQRPAFNIAGVRRAHLLPVLDKLSPATLSRQLTRLRTLGLIRRIAGTCRYYLTRIGRSAIAACCRLTEHTIVPALAC
jgi:DNA-binding HxlR family transcriptional regulator